MTTEQVLPPAAPKIDVRKNPLTWMAREFSLFKIDDLDGALFFDTSVVALALDETSYLDPYRKQQLPELAVHSKQYLTITRHLPQKHKADDGTEIQGEFGEKDSWPKLSLSNFDMYVYKAPPEGVDIKQEDLVRKITVEQSRSGKSRRIILQGRNTPDGPWISANVQFDLDPNQEWIPKAKLNSMAIYWDEGDQIQRGITFKPNYDEKKHMLKFDSVCLHRHLPSAETEEFDDRPLKQEEAALFLIPTIEKNTAYMKVNGIGLKLNLPIPLTILSKVKFPTNRTVTKK